MKNVEFIDKLGKEIGEKGIMDIKNLTNYKMDITIKIEKSLFQRMLKKEPNIKIIIYDDYHKGK